MILSGSESQVLAHALSSALDEPVLPLSYRYFADGELIIEVDDEQPLPEDVHLDDDDFIIDDRAVIVASTPTASTHLEVLQLQDLVRESDATSSITVIPYLGYARQDIAHEPGQPASARAVARALSANTDRIVTVNPHEEAVLDYFTVAAEAVSAVEALAGGLTVETDDPLIIAPDEGARPLADQLCSGIGAGTVDHFEKERIGDQTVELTTADSDVDGREVILVDDTIATGGTISAATRLLVDAGASSVQVACVHPLLVGGAYTRISKAGVDDLVATDTLERSVQQVSAAGTIASVL